MLISNECIEYFDTINTLEIIFHSYSKDILIESLSLLITYYIDKINQEINRYLCLHKFTIQKIQNSFILISKLIQNLTIDSTKIDKLVEKLIIIVNYSLYNSYQYLIEILDHYNYIDLNVKNLANSLNLKTMMELKDDIKNIDEVHDTIKKNIFNSTYLKSIISNMNESNYILHFENDNSNTTLSDEIILYTISTLNKKFSLFLSEKELNSNILIFDKHFKTYLESDKFNYNDKYKLLEEYDRNIDDETVPIIVSLFNDIHKNIDNTNKLYIHKLYFKILNLLMKNNNTFKKVSEKDMNNFIVITMNYFSELFENISKFKTIKSKKNGDRIHVITHLRNVNRTIEIINIIKNGNNNILFVKILEFFQNITRISNHSRLYSECSIFVISNLSQGIFDSKQSKLLDELYKKIFKLFDSFAESREIFTINQTKNIFSMDDISIANKLFSEFVYKDNKKVKVLFDIVISEIDKLEDYSAIPEKFLDPLLFTLIDDPVEIPNIKLIMDKISIMNHLSFSNKNPYTNENLTEEILAKYNQELDVIDRVNKFRNDLNSWKNK